MLMHSGTCARVQCRIREIDFLHALFSNCLELWCEVCDLVRMIHRRLTDGKQMKCHPD